MFGERTGEETRSVLRSDPVMRAEAVAGVVAPTLRTLVVALSFWTAICVPVVLGVSLFWGIETVAQAATFLGLTMLEAIALFGGRTYAQG